MLMVRFFLWGTLFSITFPGVGELNAHVFKDGFVERSVAIIIRPDFTTIEYSIGANETTQRTMVSHWNAEQKMPTDDTDFSAQLRQHVGPRLNVYVDQRPVELEYVDLILTPRHHVEATLVLRFVTPQPTGDAKTILLVFEDRNFDLSNAAALATPATVAELKAHAVEKAALDNDAQKREQKRSAASDGSPSKIPVPLGGAFRYACKATGGAILNRCPVAPILVRAQRFEDKTLTDQQLRSKLSFVAEVIVPK